MSDGINECGPMNTAIMDCATCRYQNSRNGNQPSAKCSTCFCGDHYIASTNLPAPEAEHE